MSFFKRLFGGAAPAAPEPVSAPTEAHAGFTIRPTPYEAQGQWQVCGEISREIAGEIRTHRFIRADRWPSRDEAVDMSLRKARQIIDEQGERLFD